MSQDFEWEMAVAIARNTGDVSMVAKLWRQRGGPEDIFAADVIEGRFRRLRERPATQEAMAEMFRRWHLVEVFKSQGHELKAAVSLAAEELRCSESAVRGAIRAIQEAQANGGEIQVKDPCASNRHLIVRKQIANIAGP